MTIRTQLEGVLPSIEEMRALRIWDGHIHLTTPGGTPEERFERMIEMADRMGIERLILARGMPPYSRQPDADEVRRHNNEVMQVVRRFPRRALGTVYLNPRQLETSLDELKRCVRDGPCVGVKLWVAARINLPAIDPIIKLAAELGAVIFQHTWILTPGSGQDDENGTRPEDLAEVAGRHPQASFVCMHAGGTWELGIRTLRPFGNVALEVSGSNPTAGFVEMAVREVGASRVTYGTDTSGRSMSTQLAKVAGANISRQDKYSIFGDNLRRLLRPIMAAKGMAMEL